jgi:hypothetical protein
MSKWMIVHFQPLEKYPPAINFIRFACQRSEKGKNRLHVITTHPGKNKKTIDFENTLVHRVITWREMNRIQRLLFYISFNVKAAWLLFKYRPQTILYYETLSAFGPWIYKKIINRKANVFIHYHEYTSPAEYQSGMLLSRWLHEREKQIYPLVCWLSHTNKDRLDFFLKDAGDHIPPFTYVLPNYPSISWKHKAIEVQKENNHRIGFVYVGALSLQGMYTREMVEFVFKHPEECFWDIYSDNHDKDVIEFINTKSASNIYFKGAISYDELPNVLPKYDIGVILYTGSTMNYEYNAPNKFFEYLSCGLNIWFGSGMKGLYDYKRKDSKPWVECVDFKNLKLPEFSHALRVKCILEQQYNSEAVYENLWDCLKVKI